MVFQGSCVALITPFTQTGVDYAALEKLIEFQIENGTDAILIAGTTGGPSTMTREEKHGVMRFAVERIRGRVPVLLGTGGNNTAAVIEESVFAEDLGASALLVVTPYYNKCTQNGLVAHYHAVCDSVHIPVIAYNVPGRTGVNITPAAFRKMAEHPNLGGIKEASGNISQIIETAKYATDRAPLYCGDDALGYTMLALGAKGVISVTANVIPAFMHRLCEAWFAGEIERAREMNFKLCDLAKAMFIEVNPIPVKTAAHLMGLCGPVLRMPLSPMEPHNLEVLKKAMEEFGL